MTNPIRHYDTSADPKGNALSMESVVADECTSLCLSNNRRYIATGGSNKTLKIWDAQNGQLVAEGYGHSAAINTVAFAADDKQLLSGGKDGVIILWNIFM